MELFDTVEIGGTRITRDGYLATNARFARSGIYIYSGAQVGDDSKDVVRVFRPPEEVFNKDAMASFAHRPVTIGHPSEAVDADNWKEHAVGSTDASIARDGEFVSVPMVLMDQEAIDIVKDGMKELSAGYTCDLEWTAGKTSDGEEYDAIQRNIRGNHLAIVSAGRAGSDCRIIDKRNVDTSQPKGHPVMSGNTLKTITVDGLSVDMTDNAAQVVQKTLKKLEDQVAELNSQLSAKDGEMAAMSEKHKTELEDAKSKVLEGKALDDAIAARSTLIDKAKKFLGDVDFSGRSDQEIRKAVVTKQLGDEAVAGRDDAFFSAAFDTLSHVVKDAGLQTQHVDPLRSAINDGIHHQSQGVNDTWNDSIFEKAGVPMKGGSK